MSPNQSNDSNLSNANAAAAYADSTIENAPPLKIVRLLYQGAIRFLDNASGCDPKAPDSKFDHWLSRTDDIVVELRLALEKDHAPEVASSLTDLYLFCEREIGRARRERSTEPLAAARGVLVTLLGAWSAIDAGKA